MNDCIIFTNPDGTCGIIIPTGETLIEDVIHLDVPWLVIVDIVFPDESIIAVGTLVRLVDLLHEAARQKLTEGDVGLIMSIMLEQLPNRQITIADLPADREFRDAWDDSNPESHIGVNLEKAKLIKAKEANAKCEEALAVITSQYSESEMKTWPRQLTESKAHVTDILAPVPIAYLQPLADARGVTVTEIANLIILKADVFDVTSIAEVGKRQAMEKAVEAVDVETDTIDDLKVIKY